MLQGLGRLAVFLELLVLGRCFEEGAIAQRRLGRGKRYGLHQLGRLLSSSGAGQSFGNLEFCERAEAVGAVAIVGRIGELLMQSRKPAVCFVEAAVIKITLPGIQSRAQIVRPLGAKVNEVFVDPGRGRKVMHFVQRLPQLHEYLVAIFALRKEEDEFIGGKQQAAF